MSPTHPANQTVNNLPSPPPPSECSPLLRSGLRSPALSTLAYGPQRRSGFTLIEILVVISIASILLTLAANVANDVVLANQVTSAGEIVSDELRLARHTAIARDRVVEVRFYKPSVPNSFGEEVGVNALQAFMFDEDNVTARPVREARPLPEGVKVSEDATLSSLITDNRLKNDWKDGDAQIPLGDAGTDYVAYRIRFLPDGSTDLDSQQQWFLTVHPRNSRETPPPNYVTVQVKPVRGTVRSFRP